MLENNPDTPDNYNQKFKGVIIKYNGLDHSEDKRLNELLKYFKGGKLLDVGCWNSPTSILAQNKCSNSEITVLDFTPASIDYWKNNYPYEAVLSDCCKTPFNDNTFDYIVAGEIIEHIENPESLVKEMIRILKPNGILALSTPNEETNNSCGGGYHIWSFKKEDIKTMFEKYGKTEVELFSRGDDRYYIIGYLEKIK